MTDLDRAVEELRHAVADMRRGQWARAAGRLRLVLSIAELAAAGQEYGPQERRGR